MLTYEEMVRNGLALLQSLADREIISWDWRERLRNAGDTLNVNYDDNHPYTLAFGGRGGVLNDHLTIQLCLNIGVWFAFRPPPVLENQWSPLHGERGIRHGFCPPNGDPERWNTLTRTWHRVLREMN